MEHPATDVQASDLQFEARACFSTYAMMAGIFIALFAGFVYLGFRDTPEDGVRAWGGAGAIGGVLFLVLLWIASFRIVISGGNLSYRSLFTGTRSIRLGDIRAAEVKIGTAEKFGPVYKLILWPEEGMGSQRITINMKVFSKDDLNRVFDVLGPKLTTHRRFSTFSRD